MQKSLLTKREAFLFAKRKHTLIECVFHEIERDENTVAYLQALKVYHVLMRTFCATKTIQIIYIIIYHLLFLVLIY